MVVRYGVGVDNSEVAEAVKRGIVVCNIPDYGTNEVADQALALMMALVRKVVYMNRRTKEDAWDCTIPRLRADRKRVCQACSRSRLQHHLL